METTDRTDEDEVDRLAEEQPERVMPRTTTTGDPDKDFRSAGDGAVEDLRDTYPRDEGFVKSGAAWGRA